MSNSGLKPPNGRPFEEDTRSVLNELRGSLAAVVSSLPGSAAIRRPTDLQRRLGLDAKLAWRLHRLATARDPVLEASGMPKVGSRKRFLQAAEKQGVPGEKLKRALAAFEEFDHLVRRHAGDLSVFETMLSGMAPEMARQADLAHRKAAFRANSHVLGVHAQAMVKCWIMRPSDEGDGSMLDMAAIRGMIGLQRLRRDARAVISRVGQQVADGSVIHDHPLEPLDPAGMTADGVGLMPEYCSKPLPEIRSVVTPSGLIEVEFAGDEVGLSSAATYFMGEVNRRVFPIYRVEADDEGAFRSQVRTPCEALVMDVLVYDGMFGPVEMDVRVYTDLLSGDEPLNPERDRLPSFESVAHVGRGPGCLHLSEAPRYAEMVESAMRRLGWDPEKFDVYRCRVEWPILPSSVMVSFPLPDRG